MKRYNQYKTPDCFLAVRGFSFFISRGFAAFHIVRVKDPLLNSHRSCNAYQKYHGSSDHMFLINRKSKGLLPVKYLLCSQNFQSHVHTSEAGSRSGSHSYFFLPMNFKLWSISSCGSEYFVGKVISVDNAVFSLPQKFPAPALYHAEPPFLAAAFS